MFPIGERRGRIIAFGGRDLDADAPAKYLNSPETPLFHKGRNLYNHAIARAAAREAGTVGVVEGYMDVIALAQDGIDHARAPRERTRVGLGTRGSVGVNLGCSVHV